MKILYYTAQFYPSLGGVETNTMDLATAFWEAGHELVLATETPTDGAEPFPFPVVRNPGKGYLLRLLADADIVFMNGHRFDFLLAAIMLRKEIVMIYRDVTMVCPKGDKMKGDQGCMVDMSVRECVPCLKQAGELKPARRLFRPQIKTLLSYFISANVCPSLYAFEEYRLANKQQIFHGIDTELFTPADRTHQAGSVRLAFAGRLVPEKGCQLLLPALKNLRDRGHPVHLEVCGDGPYRPELEALTSRLGLTSHVTFRGVVRGEALVRVMQESDIAVVPSLWIEQFGITAIEAMSCGLPVVGSNSGGLGRILAEGGVVFERGDLGQLTDRLEELVVDPELRDRLGTAAREIAVRKYDRRDMRRAYLRLIDELTG